MRRPTILDVMHAVRRVADDHPRVAAWWYVPQGRLRLAGDDGTERRAPADRPVELVVEIAPEPGASVDWEGIAGELSRHMGAAPVRVRPHRGEDETLRLYRLLSRTSVSAASAEGAE